MDNFTLTENNEIEGAVCPVCGSPVVVEFFQVDEVGDKAIYRYCCSAISSGDCVFSGGSDYSIRRVVESYRMRIRKQVEGKESPAKAGLFGTSTPRYQPGPKLSVAEDVEPEDAPDGDKPVAYPEMGLIMGEDGAVFPGYIDPPCAGELNRRISTFVQDDRNVILGDQWITLSSYRRLEKRLEELKVKLEVRLRRRAYIQHGVVWLLYDGVGYNLGFVDDIITDHPMGEKTRS